MRFLFALDTAKAARIDAIDTATFHADFIDTRFIDGDSIDGDSIDGDSVDADSINAGSSGRKKTRIAAGW